MSDASPWTRFKQGITQDLQRVWDRLGPARARGQDSWRSLSLRYKLCFVAVGLGFLMILARMGFSWDALSITGLSQDPWHIRIIGIGLALIVLLFLLWRLPKRKAANLNLDPKEQFNVENETRKTWATIVGGMAVLFSLLFTWANLRVTQDNLRVTQEATIKSQDLTRQGQITDRFTKAVAQLGEQDPEKLAVRLGGIYALERIARESKEDHWPIMEILTTYVRETSPWVREENLIPPPVAPETQAILTVLGRRNLTHRDDRSLDLRNMALHKVDLTFANLSWADFSGANLREADLREAHLGMANLPNVHLQFAQLQGAHLEGAELYAARLEHATFWRAHLEGARLLNANLVSADFSRAHFEGADLGSSYLDKGIL